MPEAMMDEMEIIRELESTCEEDKDIEQSRVEARQRQHEEDLQKKVQELVKQAEVEKEKQLRDKQLFEINENLSETKDVLKKILNIIDLRL